MYKNYTQLISLLLPFLLVLVSCDKDNAPQTQEDLLVDKSWKLVAHTSYTNGQPEDRYALTDACEQDNLLKFQKGGKMIFDEGPTKCNLSDPQIINGSWQISDNRLVLQDELSPFTVIFSIQSVSKAQMVLTQRYVDQNSMEAISTFTYQPL